MRPAIAGTAGLTRSAMLVTEGSSLCSRSKLDRVGAYPEDNGNLARRRLRRHCRGDAARSYQHGHSIANQPCRKLRQPTGVRLRPPILDLDVLALYIARRT